MARLKNLMPMFGIVCALLLVVPTADGATVIALYDFDGSNGNFDTVAFDSVDADPLTTAGRLTNHGFSVGGSGNWIVDGSVGFADPPVLNVAGANEDTATDYIAFTITPEPGVSVTYEQLTLYTNQFGDNNFNVGLRLVDGSGLPQDLGSFEVLQSLQNQDAQLITFNFADFDSSEVAEWRIYGWNTNNATHGIRFDDITLSAVVVPEPSVLMVALALLPLAVAQRGRWRRARRNGDLLDDNPASTIPALSTICYNWFPDGTSQRCVDRAIGRPILRPRSSLP